ncbi:MAG: hypothetical protein IT336_14885 [Thermomicrobiales bacterium]|nr:hypothetical protein [Thermomicrobiales bacterium]
MLNHSTAMTASRVVLVVALLAGAMLSITVRPRVSAQEAGLPVRVFACDADETIPGSASGLPLPDACRVLAGVKVSAVAEDGTFFDSCTTGPSGACALEVSLNGLRVYIQDERTLPEGYHPTASVQRRFTYTEFAEVVFVNYRDGVLPEPPSGDATLRLHNRVCPGGYGGDAFFEDCHDTIPERSQWVFANDRYAATGTDGDAVLRNLPAGETRVYAGQNVQTGDVFFYCSDTADSERRRAARTDVVIEIDDSRHLRGTVTLEPGDDLTCDWYVIPILDRGLWSSVEHWLDDGPDVTYPGSSGEIRLELFRCPEEYAGPNPTADCTEPEDFALVRAVSPEGREYDVTTTNSAGRGLISLSGIPVNGFWISLDGHRSVANDQFWCRTGADAGSLAQIVTREADRWTVRAFGDDPGGITCAWYLVPAG